jgi:hypothetical protein
MVKPYHVTHSARPFAVSRRLNGNGPQLLTLRWHRGHARNRHDRGVHPTLNGATVAARWGGRDRGRACCGGSVHSPAGVRGWRMITGSPRNEPQEGGFGFSQATATVRLVCAAWKAVHDAKVMRLLLRLQTTDEAVGMLARWFPSVVSLESKGYDGDTAALTDQGLRAVSSLPALTFLDLTMCRNVTDEGVRAVVSTCTALQSLNLTCCTVTDEGVRAVSSCTALQSLNLWYCTKLTDEGVRAVSSLPALQSLSLRGCREVTDVGVRAVSTCTALTTLNLRGCYELTDAGVRALSSLPALTSLDLRLCNKVTAAGVQALRSTTVAPNLHIEF